MIYIFYFLAVSSSFMTKDEIDSIVYCEKEIEILEIKKEKLKKSISRHLDKAQRWQFCRDQKLEARKEFELAEQEQDKIKSLDLKMRNLRKKIHESTTNILDEKSDLKGVKQE